MTDEPVAQPQGQPEGEPAAVEQFQLDPRFKTVEDQAKAYKEAEKLMTQRAQEAAELKRQLEQERLVRQTPQPVAQPVAQPEEDLNELYWKEPAKVMERLIGKHIEPFYTDRYEMQKAKYANDPEFQKHVAQIDQMVSINPQLKNQTGIVDKLYRVARAMEFDPDSERKRIEAEVMARFQSKQAGLVEGAGSPGAGPTPVATLADLTDEEKRVAVKFNSDLPQAEAFKKYAERKAKWAQGV